jgi:hypothetical protein
LVTLSRASEGSIADGLLTNPGFGDDLSSLIYVLGKRKSEYTEVSCEGCVDGGIAAAVWSPDLRFLLILTNNDTLICMTNNWEVVNEISLDPRVPGSRSALSWRDGDGDFFALFSIDASDGIGRVRMYTKELVYVGVSHSVGGGGNAGSGMNYFNPNNPTNIIRHYGNTNSDILLSNLCFPGQNTKGVGCVEVAALAFSSHANGAGGLAAVPRYKKAAGSVSRWTMQIAFLESNGLHHGEVEVRVRCIRFKFLGTLLIEY